MVRSRIWMTCSAQAADLETTVEELQNLSPQEAESLLQKRLSEVVGSVRQLALSDLDYDADADEPLLLKADDDTPGRLIAQFSVAGIKDSYGDIITQAAFDEMNGKALGMVWSHDRSRTIGRGVVRMEGKKAIWDGQLFVGKGVPDADMARTIISEMKSLQEYSWGFRIREAKPIKVKGPDGQMTWMGGFEITKVDAIEVSPVLKGAHPKTKTISIKAEATEVVDAPQVDADPADADATRTIPPVVESAGMTVAQEFEAVLVAASAFTARMQALDAMRMEERERHLSAENQGRLNDLRDALDETRTAIEALLTTVAAERGVPIGDRFRFADLSHRKHDFYLTTGD
jgi:hypothetical protein